MVGIAPSRNDSFFNTLIIALVIGIVIVGALAGLKLSGVLDGEPEPVVIPGRDPGLAPGTDREPGPVAGLKNYTWTYLGEEMTFDLFISNRTYREFAGQPHPAAGDGGEGLTRYIVASGDGGAIDEIATWFLEIGRDRGFGDYDTVGNLLAFVGNITYVPGTVGHPRYPIETLAEGEGDSTDHALLAASALSRMGYGVGLLYYPPAYDRGTIIPEATALALVCDDSVPGHRYTVHAEAPAGRIVYFPANGTCMGPCEGETRGWYAGLVTSETGEAVSSEGRYYPANQTFVLGNITPPPEHPACIIENATWTVPLRVIAVWTTELTGRGAYDGQDPIFIGDEGLWDGRPLSRDAGITGNLTAAKRMPLGEEVPFTVNETESLTDLLRIATPDRSGAGPEEGWREEAADYYADCWFPADVSWTHHAGWKLFDHALAVGDDGTHYDPRGVAHITSPTAWRIVYTIREADGDDNRDLKGMTPYSDVRFVVYRIDEANSTATLDRTFGWQSRWGSEKRKNEAVFGPGTYDIAVFVRNCVVDVEIQYHGKPERPTYGGGV